MHARLDMEPFRAGRVAAKADRWARPSAGVALWGTGHGVVAAAVPPARRHLETALRHDRAGREPEAIPEYQAALQAGLDPSDERVALICLASSFREVGNVDEARTTIDKARRRFRGDAVVDAFAALVLLDAGQGTRAVRLLGLALCEHARRCSLEGFEDALRRKFRGLTRGPSRHAR